MSQRKSIHIVNSKMSESVLDATSIQQSSDRKDTLPTVEETLPKKSDYESQPGSQLTSSRPQGTLCPLDKMSMNTCIITKGLANGEAMTNASEDIDKEKQTVDTYELLRMPNSNNHKNGWSTVEAETADELQFVEMPVPVQGYMQRKRRWPFRGWQVSFFYLNGGKLYYANDRIEMARIKLQGKIDLKKSVISHNAKKKRIDIDSNMMVFHIKLEREVAFNQWVNRLADQQNFAKSPNSADTTILSFDMETIEINDIHNKGSVTQLGTETPRIKKMENESNYLIFEMEKLISQMMQISFPKTPKDFEDKDKKKQEGIYTLCGRRSSHEESEDNSRSCKSHRLTKALNAFARKKESQDNFHEEFLNLAQELLNKSKSAQDYIYKNGIQSPKPKLVDKIASDGSVTPPFVDANDTFNAENQLSDSDTDESTADDCSDVLNKSFTFNEYKPLVTHEEIRESYTRVTASKNKYGRRTILLNERPNVIDIGMIHLLKKNIGKHVKKYQIPVALNEPLTLLQRLCEELEYSELLTRAAEEKNPEMRMAFVAAFSISTYAHTQQRATTMPFIPLRYETYECERPEKGWRFIAEQVSHKPLISACHTEHELWTLDQELSLNIKFWGQSYESIPYGGLRLHLKSFNETYTWSKVITYVDNVLGNPENKNMIHLGEKKIVCKESGVSCKLRFRRKTEFPFNETFVSGSIQGEHNLKVAGLWCCDVFVVTESMRKCIWKAHQLPEHWDIYYGFTKFAIELNEELDEEAYASGKVPITDSRRRPDTRVLELGDLAKAQKLKMSLMQAQKALSKNPVLKSNDGCWFKKLEKKLRVDGLKYEYSNLYWQEKEKDNFNNLNLPNVFHFDV